MYISLQTGDFDTTLHLALSTLTSTGASDQGATTLCKKWRADRLGMPKCDYANEFGPKFPLLFFF